MTLALSRIADREPLEAADSAVPSPAMDVASLVHAALDLLIDGERGVWHLSHPGAVT